MARRVLISARVKSCEPAREAHAVDRLGHAPGRELRVLGDVGRSRDLVLVADDQDVVLRRDHTPASDELAAWMGADYIEPDSSGR